MRRQSRPRPQTRCSARRGWSGMSTIHPLTGSTESSARTHRRQPYRWAHPGFSWVDKSGAKRPDRGDSLAAHGPGQAIGLPASLTRGTAEAPGSRAARRAVAPATRSALEAGGAAPQALHRKGIAAVWGKAEHRESEQSNRDQGSSYTHGEPGRPVKGEKVRLILLLAPPRGSGSAFERTEFFFLSANFGCDGVESLGEVVEAVGESGHGEQFAVAGAVGVDDGAELPVAVAGGAADAAVLGDGGEGDVASGGEQLFAGSTDAVSRGAHRASARVWLINSSSRSARRRCRSASAPQPRVSASAARVRASACWAPRTAR